jgi:hypothetical protein
VSNKDKNLVRMLVSAQHSTCGLLGFLRMESRISSVYTVLSKLLFLLRREINLSLRVHPYLFAD